MTTATTLRPSSSSSKEVVKRNVVLEPVGFLERTRIRSYSSIEEIDRDLSALYIKVNRQSKVFNNISQILIVEATSSKEADFLKDKKITTACRYIESLKESKVKLNNLELATYHQFPDLVDQQKAIKVIKAKIQSEELGLRKRLNDIASFKAPPSFKKFITASLAPIKKKLGDAQMLLAFEPTDKGISFIGYLHYKNLKDRNNYTNSNLYVSLSKTYSFEGNAPQKAISCGCSFVNPVNTITCKSLESVNKELLSELKSLNII